MSNSKLLIYCAHLRGSTSVASQLNYITYIVLELKLKLANIKIEVEGIKKKQLSLIHLSLIHNGKSDLAINTTFHHKYPFQNSQKKNPFPLQDVKTKKEVEKSSQKKEKKKRAEYK